MLEEVTMERVLERENLRAAYLKVKANNGAPGVDGMTVEELAAHIRRHWGSISAKLLASEYTPAAVRGVEIPKASGGQRLLGIPSVLDRTIQQAVLQVLSPVFEAEFSASSYGFRPGRSAHDAVRAAQEYVTSGKCWVVDIDLKNFFDQVNHDRLMTMVGRKINDKRVLKLIGGFLRAPMRFANGRQQARRSGTPQGGPLSPLLANIYLDPLDKELENRGVSFVRYADDIAIFASSERSAHRILAGIIAWLSKHLGLQVNEEKSGVGLSSDSSLLGFRLYEDGHIGIAPKAIAALKERVRQCWDGRQSVTMKELRKQWREYIYGWWNYFRLADRLWGITDLGGWIRHHIRKYLWQRWHHPRGRLRALQRLGVSGRALGMAWCGLGAWAIARHHVLQRALTNKILASYGFDVPWDLKVGRK